MNRDIKPPVLVGRHDNWGSSDDRKGDRGIGSGGKVNELLTKGKERLANHDNGRV